MRSSISVFCVCLCLCLGFAAPASAGCCESGSTNYPNYSGVMQVQVGGSTCYFNFRNCNVVVYSYTYCEDGAAVVPSFKVTGFPPCEHTQLGPCAIGNYLDILSTLGGMQYVYSKICPF